MSAKRDRRPAEARAPAEGPIPVVLVGRDERARILARALLAHPELQLVATVDKAKAPLPEAPSIPVVPRATEAFPRAKGGVVVLGRGHRLDEIARELLAAIEAGLSVVSTCEELIHAPFVDPEFAETIDEAAWRRRVSVLGIGLHPGFFFDRLVTTVAGAIGHPQRVEAARVVDPAGRSWLLEAAGVGLIEAAFDEAVEAETVGQRGLSEACGLLADGLGFELDEVEEALDPILAEAAVDLGGVKVAPGRVLGLRQVARGFDEGKELVRLEVEMRLGAVAEDRLHVEGQPPVALRIPGGIPEDPALGWAVANAIPLVRDAEPGLLSVLDLPAA